MGNEFNDWQGEESQGHSNVLLVLHRLLRGRYILTFTLAGILAVIGAVGGYMSQDPVYQSYGAIHISPRITRVLYDNDQNTSPKEFAGLVSSQVGYLKSNRVLSLALESDRVRALREISGLRTPDMIESGLHISTNRKMPEFINITYEHVDRNVAKAVVQSVIESYMELFGDGENERNRPELVNTLNERRTDLEKTRESLVSQIRVVANKWSTDDIGLLVRNAIARIRQIESVQIDLQSQIDQYEAFAMADGTDGEEQEISVERAAQMDEMMASLLSKRISYENAKADLESAGLGHRHHDMKLVNSAIKNVNARIDTRMAQIRTGEARLPGIGANGLPTSLDQLKLSLASVEERLKAAHTAQQHLGKADLEIRDLFASRDQVDLKIAEVDERLDQIETESRVQEFAENSKRISVVEKGVTPVSPSGDRRRKMAALGFAGGGAIPVMIMLGIGYISKSVRFSDDVILAGSQGIVGMLPDLGESLGDQELAEASAFAVHQIRSQLQIKHCNKDRGTVYEVTSPSSQDGKTSLIIAMGLSFSESGDSTLLLDLDLIGRGLSIHFGYPNAPSLVEGMMDQTILTGLIKPTSFDGLSILPAGFGDDTLISRLSPSLIRKLLDELRSQYDTVLVDTGPILGSIEAGFLASESDGVILVVGRGQLRPLIRRAIEQINGVGGMIVATIFNRASGYELRQSTGTMSVHFSRQAARQAAEAASRTGPRVGPVAGTLFADRIKQSNEKKSDNNDSTRVG
ncbi:MAG: AAA family ATPase [Phycisphaerales bacterium]|nr:AAA family ATPase [Phycisphaerales bacterium]